MSNLIDVSFFVGEINIPNTDKPAIIESINLFITKYEHELLNSLLGQELYGLMQANPSDQRFINLISGDATNNWRGLIYNYGDSQQYSLIAYYVYWWYIKDKQIWNSGVGTARPSPSNAEVMPVYMKMMTAWNTFSDQVMELYWYLQNNSDTYPEWCSNPVYNFTPVNDFDI